MIRINRTTDIDGRSLWVVGDFQGVRGYHLFDGLDVNDAVAAAMKNGLPREECERQVKEVLARVERDKKQVNDDLRASSPFA